jgi:hypothetical protein
MDTLTELGIIGGILGGFASFLALMIQWLTGAMYR